MTIDALPLSLLLQKRLLYDETPVPTNGQMNPPISVLDHEDSAADYKVALLKKRRRGASVEDLEPLQVCNVKQSQWGRFMRGTNIEDLEPSKGSG